jgi:hypothetical protein
MVAFVPTNLESEESWTAPGDLKALAAEYAGWDDPVVGTIGALDQTFRWGIYDRAPLPYWSTGRMTLLGDARDRLGSTSGHRGRPRARGKGRSGFKPHADAFRVPGVAERAAASCPILNDRLVARKPQS